ncbi:MAG TPA: hypothetical protein VMV86_05815 [Methanosarcinales archaeon]|nr:hypothetical protein [Methanosarcinales archaeon]
MLKRYLLFAYDDYYPSGGMNDFVSSFDSLDEIEDFIKTRMSIKDWSYAEVGHQLSDQVNNITIYDQENNKHVDYNYYIGNEYDDDDDRAWLRVLFKEKRQQKEEKIHEVKFYRKDSEEKNV